MEGFLGHSTSHLCHSLAFTFPMTMFLALCAILLFSLGQSLAKWLACSLQLKHLGFPCEPLAGAHVPPLHYWVELRFGIQPCLFDSVMTLPCQTSILCPFPVVCGIWGRAWDLQVRCGAQAWTSGTLVYQQHRAGSFPSVLRCSAGIADRGASCLRTLLQS